MQLPQTSSTSEDMDEFIRFIDAWLCYPLCDANDLEWDYNDDDQINFTDWAYHCDDFILAFRNNGRYVLTDFRNSVIGVTDANNNLIEISYNAWGTPSYSGNLDGLNILWNGYYFDEETDNYYLRNRYYSPLERKFVTDDQHGINPDGNWNNPFYALSQYSDGYGLTVYSKSDPINGWDDWGLWSWPWNKCCGNKKYNAFIQCCCEKDGVKKLVSRRKISTGVKTYWLSASQNPSGYPHAYIVVDAISAGFYPTTSIWGPGQVISPDDHVGQGSYKEIKLSPCSYDIDRFKRAILGFINNSKAFPPNYILPLYTCMEWVDDALDAGFDTATGGCTQP